MCGSLSPVRPAFPSFLPNPPVAQNDDYILEILIETSLINKSQLERARAEMAGEETVIEALIRLGIVTQEDVTRALAAHAAMDFVDLSAISISEEIIGMVPREVALIPLVPLVVPQMKPAPSSTIRAVG